MVKRQRLVVAGGAGLLLLALLYVVLQGRPVASGAGTGPAAEATGEQARGDLPRIDLSRVQSRPSRPGVGQRDLFGFATPPPPPPPPAVMVATPPPMPELTAPTPTPLPPLNVKYIGSVEQRGVRVALFMNEQKEILSGQVGQTVMNRFRVVRIGIESVDVEEVGSGQVRRIPLRGN